MGINGLLTSIVTVFQAFALLWIAGFVAAGIFLVRALVRSRDSEWIRSQDEIDRMEERARAVQKAADGRPEQAA